MKHAQIAIAVASCLTIYVLVASIFIIIQHGGDFGHSQEPSKPNQSLQPVDVSHSVEHRANLPPSTVSDQVGSDGAPQGVSRASSKPLLTESPPIVIVEGRAPKRRHSLGNTTKPGEQPLRRAMSLNDLNPDAEAKGFDHQSGDEASANSDTERALGDGFSDSAIPATSGRSSVFSDEIRKLEITLIEYLVARDKQKQSSQDEDPELYQNISQFVTQLAASDGAKVPAKQYLQDLDRCSGVDCQSPLEVVMHGCWWTLVLSLREWQPQQVYEALIYFILMQRKNLDVRICSSYLKLFIEHLKGTEFSIGEVESSTKYPSRLSVEKKGKAFRVKCERGQVKKSTDSIRYGPTITLQPFVEQALSYQDEFTGNLLDNVYLFVSHDSNLLPSLQVIWAILPTDSSFQQFVSRADVSTRKRIQQALQGCPAKYHHFKRLIGSVLKEPQDIVPLEMEDPQSSVPARRQK